MLQKNAIFSGLVTFTHYMVMLGKDESIQVWSPRKCAASWDATVKSIT
jgi:hypothetical protein